MKRAIAVDQQAAWRYDEVVCSGRLWKPRASGFLKQVFIPPTNTPISLSIKSRYISPNDIPFTECFFIKPNLWQLSSCSNTD
jgi:hypothetical protein